MTEQPERLPAGRIGRAHGLDGSFYVTRPDARLLKLGTIVVVTGRELEIVRRSGTEQRPILRLEGIESRESIEPLRGEELTVARSEAPALAEGEWWAHELEGCSVVDGEHLVGTVSRLLVLPSCEALEVRPSNGGESVLVPMVKDAVRSVTPAERRIEVNLAFLGLAAEPRSTRELTKRRERGGCP
ncbi:MAG TPA: ribosome maturation factor RimM [Solirubrobacteraceae bacterium]|nr:ribosome maturation factor RimM [Solirubrobacteraceae bacterium]